MRHTFYVTNEGSEISDELQDDLNGALMEIGNTCGERTPLDPLSSDEFAVDSTHISALIKARRNRDEFFPNRLFADPAWDMLLELYRAEIRQRRITVSSLCAGSAVPATTALRWIKTLEEEGLTSRESDRLDGRRFFVSLSTEGSKAMNAYFRCNR